MKTVSQKIHKSGTILKQLNIQLQKGITEKRYRNAFSIW